MEGRNSESVLLDHTRRWTVLNEGLTVVGLFLHLTGRDRRLYEGQWYQQHYMWMRL